MSLKLMNFKVLKASDNFGDHVEKVEYNFNQIMLLGGGPPGDKGEKGEDGGYGRTGKKGDKGDRGDKGTHIWFSTAIVPDGSTVTNPDHHEGDVLITSNGNYYTVIDSGGGVLVYHFEFNLLPLSGQYLISQIDFDAAGSPVDTWQQIESPTSKEANLLLVKKTTGTGNDKANFYRLLLGLDSNPTILNCTQIIGNILPFETSGVMTNADDASFAQLGLKYRPNSRSNPTTNTLFFKYYEPGTNWVFDLDNAGTKMFLINDTVDAANSTAGFTAYKQLFKTPNSLFSTITMLHDIASSTVQAKFDLAVGSLNPATGKLLINNRQVKLNYNGDTDVTPLQDTNNLNLLVNTYFKRKIKKDSSIFTITNSILTIPSVGAKPVIYLDGGAGGVTGADILDTIVGGEDNEVLTLSALARPIRIVAKETPSAGQIKHSITTNLKNSEIELNPRETITLYKKTGQSYWDILEFNRRHPLDATSIYTGDLTFANDPMESLMKFNPGVYSVLGPNLSKVSDPTVLLFPIPITKLSGGTLKIISPEHDSANGKFNRIFILHDHTRSVTMNNNIWVRRGYLAAGIYQFSDWERLATSGDLTTTTNTILTYVDTQIQAAINNIYNRLIPAYVYVPYFVSSFTNFDATGKGISGDVIDWAICNGNNGTPDLRGYFVVGATAVPNSGAPVVSGSLGTYAISATGGSRDVALTVPNLPPHVHGFPHIFNESGSGHLASGGGSDEGPITDQTLSTGTGALGAMAATPHNNLPPFKAAVWIMKMPVNTVAVPPVCGIPQQFQFTAATSGGLYSFKFKHANATFPSIDLKWAYNNGTIVTVNIPFSSITSIGGGYFTFNFQIPSFVLGQYSFSMRVNCAATDHSAYTGTIVNNATGAAQYLVEFIIDIANPTEYINKAITNILVVDTVSAVATQLLSNTDPSITKASGPMFCLVPAGAYNISIGITGNIVAFAPSVELLNPNHAGESIALAYTGPSTYQFLNKTVSDDQLLIRLTDA